jgi:hypothetical protein
MPPGRLAFVAIGAVIGVVTGYVAGRFLSKLPTGWAVLITSVFASSLWLWAFRELRRLEERKRILNDMLRRCAEYSKETS